MVNCKFEKRIRVPRDKAPAFRAVVSDAAYFAGHCGNESAIITDAVLAHFLPTAPSAYKEMLAVYGGKNLLMSVADVVKSLEGRRATQACRFGLRLACCWERVATGALADIDSGLLHWRLGRCRDQLLRENEAAYLSGAIFNSCSELDRLSERFDDDPLGNSLLAGEIVNFEMPGAQETREYLSCLFGACARADFATTSSPELRREWAAILEEAFEDEEIAR